MKKLYYFLLMALPVLFLASCDDDDDNLPDVKVSIEIDGGVSVDGTIYVVKGDTLTVEGIKVINVDANKTAMITSAAYSWDYMFAGVSVNPPYGIQIATNNVNTGNHLLQIECPLFAVDKSPATLYMAYKVAVVDSIEDIPAGKAVKEFIDNPGIKEN